MLRLGLGRESNERPEGVFTSGLGHPRHLGLTLPGVACATGSSQTTVVERNVVVNASDKGRTSR